MEYHELPKEVRRIVSRAYDLSQHCTYDTPKDSISRIISKELAFMIEELYPEQFYIPTMGNEHNVK
jgi:hypothetical protein